MIPENRNKIILPEISLNEMNKLIKKLKPSHCTGHDQITKNTNKVLFYNIKSYIDIIVKIYK